MQLTPQQSAFIEALKSTPTSIALIAAAGSGKTSTLCLAVEELDPSLRILVLAFNRRIRDELSSRMPSHVDCLTLNGLGHRAWARRCSRRCTPDAGKLGRLTTELLDEDEKKEFWEETLKLARAAKVHGLVPKNAVPPARRLLEDEEDNWFELADLYDIDITPAVIPLARRVLSRSIHIAFHGDIDFDDQLYMPVVYGARFPEYDIVLVDEAQDLSNIQHEMLAKTCKGRLIAVGDPRQAIYAFRGAMNNSMETLARRFEMDKLPLSVSFRCPKLVVEEARKITTDIDPWEDAPEGLVETGIELTSFWPADKKRPDNVRLFSELPYGTALVCRNNSPLVSAAYKAIKLGLGVTFIGRDFGKGLKKLVEKVGPDLAIPEFLRQLYIWRDQEIAKALAKFQEAKVEQIQDKTDSLAALADAGDHKTGRDLLLTIDRIFSADSGHLVLSSIHRAKGLEWPNVVFLEPGLVPRAKLKQLYREHPDIYYDAYQQEMNCRYVAVTRAKATLTFAVLREEKEE